MLYGIFNIHKMTNARHVRHLIQKHQELRTDHLAPERSQQNPFDNIETEFDLYELEPEAAVNF